MSFTLKQKSYENPRTGIHNSTITRVEDLGLVETSYGTKDKFRVVFQTQQKGKDGSFLEVRQNFNKSLHEKAAFVKFLKSMKINPGAAFTPDDLIGTKLQIVVEHSDPKDGKVFANISSYLPLEKQKKGTKPTPPPVEEEETGWDSDSDGSEEEETDEI